MLATLASLAAAVHLLAGILFAARRFPGYRHTKHTISELGEVGAPQQSLVAYGVFLPVGILLLIAFALAVPKAPAVAGLALAIAVGYLVAVVFPCDRGSPSMGSTRQLMHNLGGAVEYLGGGMALLVIAEHVGQPFEAAGVLVLAAALVIGFLPSGSVRGLVQRIGETVLFTGLIFSAWTMTR